MRRNPFLLSLLGALLVSTVALAAPMEAAATADAADTASDGLAYVPDAVATYDGEVLRALRGEGLSPEQIEEVAAALRDAEALSTTDVRPMPICDFACGVRCPVRWEHIRVVVDSVREWQRRHLCRGQTDCGSLYECVYRVLIVHQTWLNVCNCDPDPTNPWDDYGCYWYTGASFLRECTEPTCRRVRPVVSVRPTTDAAASLR